MDEVARSFGVEIFNRNGNELNIGNIRATIPSGIAALGLIANNKVNDGEEFRADYWVYKDGKKIRKWFGPTYEVGKVIWTPHLSKEWTHHWVKVWAKCLEKTNKSYKVFNQASKQLLNTKEKEAHYVHSSGYSNTYAMYENDPDTVHMSTGNKESIKVNTDLGDILYPLERICYKWACRLGRFKNILKHCMVDALGGQYPKGISSSKIVKVIAGNKIFWFHTTYNRSGVLEWEILAWPDSDIMEVKIEEGSKK